MQVFFRFGRFRSATSAAAIVGIALLVAWLIPILGHSLLGNNKYFNLLRPAAISRTTASSMTSDATITASSSTSFPLPPTRSSNTRNIHLIVLVHGYLGNPKEMSYLQEAIERRTSNTQQEEKDNTNNNNEQDKDEEIVLVHAATCNDGKTLDGIAAGGQRLADEINQWIDAVVVRLKERKDSCSNDNDNDEAPMTTEGATTTTTPEISLSIVGNSLGGLYARYALRDIDWDQHGIQRRLFCTTATPHLGVSSHTYLPLPRFVESTLFGNHRAGGIFMGDTGRDLFRFTNVLDEITTNPEFVEPLQQFEYRWALSNAYHTDFQVPTATAAFLSDKLQTSNHRQVVIDDEDHDDYDDNPLFRHPLVPLVVQTQSQQELPSKMTTTAPAQQSGDAFLSSEDLARQLDDMGWTKIFCDVRDGVPSVPVYWPFASKSGSNSNNDATLNDNDKTGPVLYTSAQLYRQLSGYDASGSKRLYLPFGHTVMVANAKNSVYTHVNRFGRPLMDQLAASLLLKTAKTRI